MYVSDENKFVFVAVPRTASRSVSGFLKFNYGARQVEGHHPVIEPDGGWADWMVLASSRNPYSWMWSKYNSLPTQWHRDHAKVCRTFRTFIQEGLRRKETGEDLEGPYYPQSRWIYRGHDIPRKNIRIIRFERMVEDIEALPFVDGPVSLPHIGRRKQGYRNAYNQELMEMVSELCSDDFEFHSDIYDPAVL